MKGRLSRGTTYLYSYITITALQSHQHGSNTITGVNRGILLQCSVPYSVRNSVSVTYLFPPPTDSL